MVQPKQQGADSLWFREIPGKKGRREILTEQKNVDHRSYSSLKLSLTNRTKRDPLKSNVMLSAPRHHRLKNAKRTL